MFYKKCYVENSSSDEHHHNRFDGSESVGGRSRAQSFYRQNLSGEYLDYFEDSFATSYHRENHKNESVNKNKHINSAKSGHGPGKGAKLRCLKSCCKPLVIDLVKSDRGAKSAKDRAKTSSVLQKLAADVKSLKHKSKQIKKATPVTRHSTRRER